MLFNSGIGTMQSILALKMAGEDFGNSIQNNSKWKELGLPDHNRYNLYKGRLDRPSSLYSGTELLGALEGLDYLLTNKANDANRRDQSTKISLFLDGGLNGAAGGTPEPIQPRIPSPARPFRFPKASTKKTSPPQASSTTTRASRTFSKTTRTNGSGRRCKKTSMPPSID